MDKKLTVITTCTNKKSDTAVKGLSFADYADRYPPDVAKIWTKHLKNSKSMISCRDLYLGSHWIESLSCEESALNQGIVAETWVLSAGYGLVCSNEKLASYAASFSQGRDSVQNLGWPHSYSQRQKVQAWWNFLHRHQKRPNLSRFMSLSRTKDPLLFIISRDYYNAIESELIDLVSAGVNVLIVSAGMYRNLNSASPIVRPHILPFSEDFKQVDAYLNKTNVSLNARLANWMVQHHAKALLDGLSATFSVVDSIKSNLAPLKRKEVKALTDEEVLAFISSHYNSEYNSATRLLRLLRNVKNLSCEQKRFGALFQRYQESKQGNLFENE